MTMEINVFSNKCLEGEIKMKKTISLIVALILIFSAVPGMGATEDEINAGSSVIKMQMAPVVEEYNNLASTEVESQAKRFSDIDGHFARQYIAKMAAINILAGYPDGRFGPNDTLLACHFITMIIHGLGYVLEVPPGTPYWRPCVDKALEMGIIGNGEISDYTGPLTRELAAVIAFRTLMLYEARPAEADTYYDYNVSKMSDYARITDRYKDDVVMSYRMGLITGSNNLFVPQGTLTRAQGCIIVNKLIDGNIRIASVPQESEIVTFRNGDCSEYYFPDAHPNKEYTFIPGNFPLNEIYNTVRTLVQSKDKMTGGYLVQGYDEKTQFFSADLYKDKATAERFLFEEPRLPTASASFAIWTNKVMTQGALTDKGTGFLYSLDVWDCITYNNNMKAYTYEIFKTLFGNDADKAIALHDKYLNIPLKGLGHGLESVTLNDRYVTLSAGTTAFHIEIYAKGAIR